MKNIVHFRLKMSQEQKYSNGENVIGIETVIEEFKKMEYVNYPIISVGSGHGLVEKEIEEELGINIICVDPDPLSFDNRKKLHKTPDYNTVDDMDIDFYKNNCQNGVPKSSQKSIRIQG